MKASEQLLTAMNNIGDDLVVMAEQQRFGRALWQRILPIAACAALIFATAAYLHPKVKTEPSVQEPAAELAMPEPADSAESAADAADTLQPARPFYIYRTDPEDTNAPAKAIAPDGRVLLEVDSGQIAPLVDQATGEYLAITVCHYNGTLEDFSYDVYTLDGEPVVENLAAYDLDCLGQLILVQRMIDGQSNAVLYDRTTGEVVQGDFQSGIIYGDTLWMTTCEVSETSHLFFFADGSSAELHGQLSDLLVWDDRLYLITQTETGYGLLDSRGQALLPPAYAAIYGITDGYARCKDGDRYVLVELASGEEAFCWPYDILQAWDELVMVHQGGTYALVEWDGNVLLEGSVIYTLDGEDAGTPALCAVVQEERVLYVQPDGEILSISSKPEGNLILLSDQTVAWQEPDGQLVLRNLRDGTVLRPSAQRYDGSLRPLEENGKATGLLTAAYTENGVDRYDVIREDGTILLEGLPSGWDRQSDVFYTDQDGGGLLRLDGSWLYRARELTIDNENQELKQQSK